MTLTYGTTIAPRPCGRCGAPVLALTGNAGGLLLDPEPSTSDAEQFAVRVDVEEVGSELPDVGSRAVAGATLLMQDEAANLKRYGRALYRVHGCGITITPEPGPVMPWRNYSREETR